MIVCVCHRLNCRKVDEAIREGATTPAAIQAHHGNRFQCGKCVPEMCSRIREQQSVAVAIDTPFENALA